MNILRATRFIQPASFNSADTYKIEEDTNGLKLSTPNVTLRLNNTNARVDATKVNITDTGSSTTTAGLRVVDLSIYRSSTSPLVYHIGVGATSLLRLNDSTPYVRIDAKLRVIAPDTMADVVTIERTFSDTVQTSPEIRYVCGWIGTGDPPTSLAIGGIRWRLLNRDGARIYANPVDYSGTNADTELRVLVSKSGTMQNILRLRGDAISFFGATPATKQTVNGKLAGTGAITSLVNALTTYGLITNSTDVTVPSVTGSRGGNAALASLLTQLDSLGIIINNTTA
jgi:hypothetical protein